jgi:hypothetical protein
MGSDASLGRHLNGPPRREESRIDLYRQGVVEPDRKPFAAVPAEVVGPVRRLIPLPIVVDADVLYRNVDYTVRQGWTGALIRSASPDYTLWSGVVLFATPRVLDEVERRLDTIAARQGVAPHDVRQVWNEIFLPRIRIVNLEEHLVDDPRVRAVRKLHENDAPTAALAVTLAPCLLLTDNRKHFRPLGISDRPTDEIALDAYALSTYLTGMNGTILISQLTGTAVIEGSKKVASSLGRNGTVIIALILLGAAYLYWRSEPGGRLRQSVKSIAREAGQPLIAAVENGLAVSDRVSALAIEPPDEPHPALHYVMYTLATQQTVMSTAEIVQLLRRGGYTFSQTGDYRTQTRAWLLKSECFFEMRRGRWAVGYHPNELPIAGELA